MPDSQQQINYGNSANDGTGDPLRTAFIKVDDNFDAVWNAGPVGSNITVLNNTISTVNVNGNLVLSPNGVGVIQTNSRVIPRLNNTYDLGAANLTYRSAYIGTGGLSVAGNITGNTTGFAIGYRDIPQVSFTGNATIATTDAGKHYYSILSTANVLTIANNASQGFQTGAAISIVNQGTGNITIAQGSGVTLYLAGNATSGNRTLATFGMATIMKVATNTWFINGTGVS